MQSSTDMITILHQRGSWSLPSGRGGRGWFRHQGPFHEITISLPYHDL